MYENYVSNNTIPARSAKEVALRARQQEKEMALLKAEYKAVHAPNRRRSMNGVMHALLAVLGLG